MCPDLCKSSPRPFTQRGPPGVGSGFHTGILALVEAPVQVPGLSPWAQVALLAALLGTSSAYFLRHVLERLQGNAG
jgi:hypothetical protein